MKFLTVLCFLFSASALFAYNLPVLDTLFNLGPITWYPDSAKDRKFKMPFDSGVVCTLSDCSFNRPNSHHKGYEYDFPKPWGTPVLAVSQSWVQDIIMNQPGSDNQVIMRHRDVLIDGVTYTTTVRYLHIYTDSTLIKVTKKVEQGQLIGYIGQQGMWDHVHIEAQMANHTGIGCFQCAPWKGFMPAVVAGIESVPAPFVEVTMHPDGILWRGDIVTSQNKRFVPLEVETAQPKVSAVLLTVSPNPASADVRFTAGMTASAGSARLVIYSVNGKKVADLSSALVKRTEAVWKAATLPRGIYIAQFSAGPRTASLKIALVR